MATDQQIEQLFDSVRPRIADITSRTGTHSGQGNLGCALMVLPIIGGTVLLANASDVVLPSPALFWWFVAAVLVAMFLCVVAGWKLWRPWSLSNSALQVETDDALIRPLVGALVTGGTFSRPVVTTSGYHPSLLQPHTEKGSVRLLNQSRVEGRLADMPVVIEEIQGGFDAVIDDAWIARFELPFAVAGHLRIWVSERSFSGWAEWRDGFETQAEATERLGSPYTVDVAPIGTGPGAAGATVSPAALPPEVVCTDELFDALRARPDMRLAVVDRTLWMVVPRNLKVFQSHIAAPRDLKDWKKAALAVRDIEAIARAILAAPGVRG